MPCNDPTHWFPPSMYYPGYPFSSQHRAILCPRPQSLQSPYTPSVLRVDGQRRLIASSSVSQAQPGIHQQPPFSSSASIDSKADFKPSLASCPDEIIEAISSEVHVHGIEAFAFTSKKIYGISQKVLGKHWRLKRKYAFADCTSRPWALSRLLDDVLTHSHTAGYVKGLKVKQLFHGYNDRRNNVTQKELEEWQQLFDTAAPIYVPLSMIKRWLHSKSHADERPVLALLLFLLPNLTTLDTSNCKWDWECLQDTLKLIVYAYTKTAAVPLSKLTTINIGQRAGPHFWNILRPFEVLNILPSMSSISMWDTYCPNPPRYWPNILLPRSSNVTELSLISSTVNAKKLSEFVATFKCLRSFSHHGPFFEAYRPQNHHQPSFNPFRTVTILKEHAENTLEHLMLRSNSLQMAYMGKIQTFKNLRTLETESNLLLRTRDFKYRESLTLSLPPKLEKLLLHVAKSQGKSILAAMLLELATQKTKQRRLPNLQQVTIIHHPDDSIFDRDSKLSQDRVIHLCKIHGISLTIRASLDSFTSHYRGDAGQYYFGVPRQWRPRSTWEHPWILEQERKLAKEPARRAKVARIKKAKAKKNKVHRKKTAWHC